MIISALVKGSCFKPTKLIIVLENYSEPCDFMCQSSGKKSVHSLKTNLLASPGVQKKTSAEAKQKADATGFSSCECISYESY